MHKHKWTPTGLFDEQGDIRAPCIDPKCEAYMVKHGDEYIVHQKGFGASIHGMKLLLEDDKKGGVAKLICKEVEESYHLDTIDFHDGDVVLDIGAHIGVISIYLAKKYPGLRIYAFEPIEANFQNMLANIEANQAIDITPVNCAVTGDGRDIQIGGDSSQNTGGFSMYSRQNPVTVHSVTLEQIFKAYHIERVKLLKIDCEGCEYEVLRPHMLGRVDHLRGELHVGGSIPYWVAEQALNTYRQHVNDMQFTISDIGG